MRLKLIYAGFLVAFCLPVLSAELSLDPVFAAAGSAAPLVVRLGAVGSNVAAIQFDLDYDATLALTANPGSVVFSAGKEVYSAPVSARRTRFLVVGMNQNAIGDGVVTTINAFVSANTVAGVFPLRLSNLVASDQDGNAIPLTGKDGSMTVSASVTLLGAGIFPQIAVGGGWKTSLTLLNLADITQPAKLTFWDDDGAPLTTPLAFSPEVGLAATAGALAEIQLAANGVAVVEMEMPASSEMMAGWAKLHAPAGIVGAATFRYRSAEGQESEAVVPMETRTPYSFVLPYDNTAGFASGVAVANGSETSDANVAITIRDATGKELLPVDTLVLPIGGHTYFALTSRYPSLAGARGSLEFRDRSGGNIAVLGLRFSPAGSFTSIPAEAK